MELLLTLEEFCAADEGMFLAPADGPGGAAFAPLFVNLLQLLYDAELVEEGAISKWAAEKEHADEDDKVYLRQVRGQPLRAAASGMQLATDGRRQRHVRVPAASPAS